MKTRGHHQYQAVSDFLLRLYSTRDLPSLLDCLTEGLGDVVESDITAYNEFDPRTGRLHYSVHPAGAAPEAGPEVLARCMSQHPLNRYYLKSGDGRPRKLSDFLSREHYHRTELYNEFFRHAHPCVEYLIGFYLPRFSETHRAVVLCRRRRDFSEGERRLLDLLRSHVIQAGQTVVEYVRLKQAADMARRRTAGHADFPQAGRLNRQSADVASPSIMLSLPIASFPDDDRRPVAVLSPREGDVLYWVARGKGNRDVAMVLGISPRTVEKHLERIFEKLGVESRTSAATLFLESIRASERTPDSQNDLVTPPPVSTR